MMMMVVVIVEIESDFIWMCFNEKKKFRFFSTEARILRTQIASISAIAKKKKKKILGTLK